MAEPAHQLPEEDRPDIRPDLRMLEGGSEGGGSQGNLHAVPNEPDAAEASNSDAVGAPRLRALEGGGKTSAPTGNLLAVGEGGAGNTLGKGFNPTDAAGKGSFKKLFQGKSKKRALIGGGGIMGLLVGGFMGFSIISGPMQLIHLSEILQRPFSSQNDASEDRLGKLLRFARSGEVGETRVRWRGSRSVAKTTANLKKVGFTVDERAGGSGRPVSYKIDRSKFAPGQSAEEAAAKLVDAGVPQDHIVFNPKTNDMYVRNPKGGPIPDNVSRAATKAGISKLYEGRSFGRILTSIKARPVIHFNGNSLHLWEKLKVRSQEKADAALKAREAKKAERSEKAKARADKIREKLKPHVKVIGAIGLGQLGICVARDIAHQVPLVEYTDVVKPAMDLATDSITYGAQTKSGQDFNSYQPGAVAKSFTDKNGNTIWQGKALNALANGDGGEGVDLSLNKDTEGIKSAFSSRSPAADVESAINKYGGSFLCSTVGTIAGAGLGLVALALSLPSGGASEAAYTAGRLALSTAATIGAVQVLMKFVPQLVADTPPMKGLMASAPLKGDVMAYGAEAMANDFYRKSGGAKIDSDATSAVSAASAQEDRQAFQSESFFARMFDIEDYRSLAGRLADSISPSLTANIANFASSFADVGHLFSSLFSSLIPKAHAADKPYDFGFPKYGFSKEDLNNSQLQDPYANASKVAKMLDNDSVDLNRVKTCFGVNITKGDHGWQVDVIDTDGGDPEKDVLPNTSKYHDANCAENSLSWLRVRLFIFDSRTMGAYSCYEGDDQACSDLGFGNSESSGSSSTGTPAATGISGNGSGKFTTDTSHAPYPGLDQMLARVKAATSSSSGAAAFCASIGGCSGKCESAVEMAWLGHRGQYLDPFGSAGNTPAAGSAWAAALASGHAHPGDRNPPVGALLIYNVHNPSDPYGHITIYLGDNLVFSTDFDHQGSVGVDPASHIEAGSWANSYVGWMDPYFSGKVGN